MKNPTLERLNGVLRRFYPIPEALIGYLFGIFFAAFTVGQPQTYLPLALGSALRQALAVELPLFFAAALLALIGPVRSVGGALIFIKSACYGFGALVLASDFPSFGYYRHVCVSIVQTALYACPLRHAADCFSSDRQSGRRGAVNYLLCWLFYTGCALLLLPLKFISGI